MQYNSWGAGEVEESVQILLNVLDECKLKISTVAHQGREDVQKCEDFAEEDDRGAREKQRYEFCRKVCVCVCVWGGFVTI